MRGGTEGAPKFLQVVQTLETKFNFIKRKIDELPVPTTGKRAYYFDTQIQRLQLQVTSSGVKTFFVRKKIGGRSERILIGHHPDLSIEQVRKKATQGQL